MKTRIDPRVRFNRFTRRDGECIVWTGSRTKQGYGLFHDGERQVLAHRWAWQHAGKLRRVFPPGTEASHTCDRAECVNPKHIKAETKKQNNARRKPWVNGNSKRTHCPRGHLRVPGNQRVNSQGHKVCTVCYTRGGQLRPEMRAVPTTEFVRT